MQKLKSMIFNMIKQGFTTSIVKDDLPFPSVEFKTNGKTTKGIPVSVYGICSSAPKKSHVLSFSVQGQESNKFVILNDFLRRKKDLLEGEAALFNSVTGAFVLMKADGTILYESPSPMNFKAPSFNFDGTMNVTGPINCDDEIIADLEITAGFASTPIELTQHPHIGNLGYNVSIPVVAGGGVAPPANPPSALTGILDMKTNDIINVGNMTQSVRFHTHTQPDDSNGDTEQPTNKAP